MAVYNVQQSIFFSEDDSDDGEGDAVSKRRSNPEAKGASKRIKIGMSESKALSMLSQQKKRSRKKHFAAVISVRIRHGICQELSSCKFF